MVVADGLIHIWGQDICNYHDDIDQSMHVRGAQYDDTVTMCHYIMLTIVMM